MNFLSQNHRKLHQTQPQLQSKSFTLSNQQNHQKKIHSLQFSSQNPSDIQQLQTLLTSSESSQKDTKIKDLVLLISKLPKTQIIQSFKLFIEFGFQLSLQPEKIAEVEAGKHFVRNFTEFTRALKENQETNDQNQKKVKKIGLNSLLYILMLLVCGEKQSSKNADFKQKLFGSKAFLKNILGISIYKHPKFSKLYGIIIVHIYKLNPSLDIKKCMVESIISNIRHCDHEKTQLNLSMILNQLKFSYNLREIVVGRQNLVTKIWDIYCKNQSKFQSVYTLNYFLFLAHQFPGLSRISSCEIRNSFEITENIKNFALTSRYFEKTFKKFFEWSVLHLNPIDAFHLSKLLASHLNTTIKEEQGGSNELGKNEKWISFLTDLTLIFVKSTPSNESLLYMVENGLMESLILILKDDSGQSLEKNKIYQVLEECLTKLRLISPRMYQCLIRVLLVEVKQIMSFGDELLSRRNKIIVEMQVDTKNISLCPMELE